MLPRLRSALAAVLLLLPRAAEGLEPSRYLIISAPRLAKVAYIRIGVDKVPQNLIEDGLRSPQGLAVHWKSSKLYVADPDAKKILGYKLGTNNGVLFIHGPPTVAAQDVESRWVAVDGQGSIFFTDERNNIIQKVSAVNVLKGDPTPTLLYNGLNIAGVSAPGGMAVDNFHTFWTNKAVGTLVGSVVRGYENPPQTNLAASVRAIAKNTQKSYGVCLSHDNVYYTDATESVFAVKKDGGAITTISDRLLAPRGCAYDSSGTVYIADKAGDAVYSFAANMYNLRPARLTKVVDFEDAFGVAVFSSGRRTVAQSLPLLLLALATTCVLPRL